MFTIVGEVLVEMDRLWTANSATGVRVPYTSPVLSQIRSFGVSHFLIENGNNAYSDALTTILDTLPQEKNTVLLRHYGHEEEYGIDISLMLGHLSYITVNLSRFLNIDIIALSNHGIDYSRPVIETLEHNKRNMDAINRKMLSWLKEVGFKVMRADDIAFVLCGCFSYLEAQIADYRKGVLNHVSDTIALRRGIPPSLVSRNNGGYKPSIIEASRNAGQNISEVISYVVKEGDENMNGLKDMINQTLDTLECASQVFDMEALNTRINELTFKEHYGNMSPINYNDIHNMVMNDTIIRHRAKKHIHKSRLKNLRKKLMRGMGLYENVFGKQDIRGFINGQDMEIEGHQFLYRLKKIGSSSIIKHSDTKGYHSIPYSLWVISKETKERVAQLCIYIPDMPILDQIVALGVRVKSCEHEAEMLKTSNIIQEGESQEISIIRGYQKERNPSGSNTTILDALRDGYDTARDDIRNEVNETFVGVQIFNNYNLRLRQLEGQIMEMAA